VLAEFPNLGEAYPEDSDLRACRFLLVAVQARRWAYRLTYEIRRDVLWVRYLYPAWYPLTHPDMILTRGG
jgi:hypothetical protein